MAYENFGKIKVWASFCYSIPKVSTRVLPPWKIDPYQRKSPDCNILPPFLHPHEFRHLKLVEIPITTVLSLIKTWLTNLLTDSLSLTYSLTHLLT